MSDVSQAASASTASFIAAIAFNSAVFGVEILAFTLLRSRFNDVYEPRSHVLVSTKRVDPISKALLGWPLAIFRADYQAIQRANGLDSYFFVRFLRLMTRLFLPIWFLTWAVLLPISTVNTRTGNNTGLDRFTFGNIHPSLSERYAAHVIIAYLLAAWVCYNVKEEMAHFLDKRQQHLVDPVHAKSVQANTVLITGIPPDYISVRALTRVFGQLPGGVKKVWINRNLKELPDIYERRLAACSKLESAETALLRTAAKIRLNTSTSNVASHAPADLPTELGTSDGARPSYDPTKSPLNDPERGTLAEQLVPRDQRPIHRLKLGFMPFALPFIGKKVDSIEWAREEIRVCTQLLEEGREVVENEDEPEPELDREGPGSDGKDTAVRRTYPAFNSAFVTFHEQIAAHLALQVLAHHEPYRMSGRWGEMSPQDVIWSNLGLNAYEQKVRQVVSYALTAALILLWAFPVALVGVISNVSGLCRNVKFLAWICKLPPSVVGIISGILPPVMLAVLTMLLPIVLRVFAKFQGIPKRTGVELSLMSRFFLFQVIHSFLIVTLGSGLVQAIPGIIKSPAQTPTLLAQKLPTASTFFLTYVILQGLSGTAGGFLQIVTLIVYYVKLVLLGSTPRSIYGIKYGARTVQWGTLFPGVTLLVVIALGYSLISPIMNGIACATFFAFYMLYKYLFLWVLEEDPTNDTGGLFYPKALQHMFVGLYINEICMFALFLLARDPVAKRQVAIPEAIIMAVLICLTAFYHWLINDSYGPLINSLPLSLADKAFKDRAEDAPLGPDGTRKGEARPEVEYGFAHPAISRAQRAVWIPRDSSGLAVSEEEACQTIGVKASSAGAVMNEKGGVDIDGPPPDEL